VTAIYAAPPPSGFSDSMPGHRVRSLYAAFVLLIAIAWAPGLLELPGGLAVAHVMAVLLFLVVARGTPRLQPLPGPIQAGLLTTIFYCTAFLCLWSFLSAFQADDPYRVGRPIVGFGIGALIYFAMARVIPADRNDKVIEYLAIGAAASAIISLAANYIGPLGEIVFGERDRAQAFFKHPNQFAIALSAITPVVMAKALSTGRGRVKWVVLLALLMLGFILAGSKANTIVVLISGFLIALFGAITHKSAVRSIGFLLFFTLLGAATMLLAWELILMLNPRMGMLLTTLASGTEIQSMLGRYYIWEVSMYHFYANPLFGQGGGALLDIETRDVDLTHSHNVILDVMRTLGVPGMVAVLIFSAAIVILCLHQLLLAMRLRSVDRFERMKLVGLTLGVFGFFLANMSSDSFGPSTTPIFWMVLALSIFQGRRLLLLAGAGRPRRPRSAMRNSYR
jgi:O-antigen ligase